MTKPGEVVAVGVDGVKGGWVVALALADGETRLSKVGRIQDIDGWYAAGDTREDVHRLAEDGIRFAIGHDDVRIEHLVPASA